MDVFDARLRTLESVCSVNNDKWSQKSVVATIITDIHEVKADIHEVKAQLAVLQQDKGRRTSENVSVNVPLLSADKANIDTMTSLSANIDTMKSKLANVDTILPTKLVEIDTLMSQLEKFRQEYDKVERDDIIELKTEHVNKSLEDEVDLGTTTETNIKVLKLQLKRLNDDINIKNNQKSKKKRDVLHQYILAITKDVHVTSPTQEQMRFFTDYVVAPSDEMKSQLLKLQLEVMEKNRETARFPVRELKSLVEILSDNSLSSDKYCRLANTVSILAKNNTSRDYVDESMKQQLKSEAGELNALSTKLHLLETKNNEMQCFVDEMAKLSDPDLRKDYELQLIVVKALQDEIKVQKKTLEENICQLANKLNEKIMQIVSNIVSK